MKYLGEMFLCIAIMERFPWYIGMPLWIFLTMAIEFFTSSSADETSAPGHQSEKTGLT